MNIEEQEREENPLLHREEITFKVSDYQETPSRQELLEGISAETGYDENTLVLDKVDQEYGKKESICTVKAYDSQEDLKKYSKDYKKERTQEEEEE